MNRVGLWITSGQGCAGICGPRYRWEEEDNEKTFYAPETRNERLVERWVWLPLTVTRVQEAYEFCLTNRVKRRSTASLIVDRRGSHPPKSGRSMPGMLASGSSDSRPLTVDFTIAPFTANFESSSAAKEQEFNDGEEKTDQDVAAPASGGRRSILDNDIFTPAGSSTIVGSSSLVPPVPIPKLQGLVPVMEAPKNTRGPMASSSSGPIMSLPFPFFPTSTSTVSPSNPPVLPFPLKPGLVPSPRRSTPSTHIPSSGSEKAYGLEGFVVRDSDELDGHFDDSPLSATHPHEDTTGEVSLQQPRTSQSLSSLGQPLSSYPLSNSRPQSARSRDSAPPRSSSSHGWSASSQGQSVLASAEPSSSGSPMSPMMPPPPRHPLAGSEYRRRRAGTAPSLSTSPRSSESLRHRNRTISVTDQTFGVAIPLPPVQGTDDNEHHLEEEYHPEGRGSIEEAEKEDSVGLLSSAPSPRSSFGALRHRTQSLVSLRRTPHGSTHEASRAPSSSSSHRSRAISLVSGSRRTPSSPSMRAETSPATSSRSRASSIARQADAHDHTFGITPSVTINWDDMPRTSPPPEEQPMPSSSNLQIPCAGPMGRSLRPSPSRTTTESEQTVSQGVARADISEAPSSYVTAPPTLMESTTEGSGGTIRSVDL